MNTPGIRQTPHGWQIYTTIGGHFRSRHLPPNTTEVERRRARDELRARARLRIPDRPEVDDASTFDADCDTYLRAVAGMPTYADRAYRIGLWKAVFHGRDRRTITSVEIRQQLEYWRQTKSVGTLNLRLTALKHLWSVLDGAEAASPARAIPRYREQELALRLPAEKTALRAIEGVSGKTKHRLLVLLWTGWPSAVLKRLRPEDIDWRKKEALTRGRLKGGGTRPSVVPLRREAVAALRGFAAADAFGPFSGSSLYAALHRSCERLKIRRFRPYDLRHLFITTVTKKSKDARGVSELALHTNLNQGLRYSRQAASVRALAAIRSVRK
jgi:integrase